MGNDIVVNGVSLMFIVLGLVQFFKETFNLSGKLVKVLSMAIGAFFGIGYQLITTPATDLASWFGVIVFGVAMGLAASGVYDVANPNK